MQMRGLALALAVLATAPVAGRAQGARDRIDDPVWLLAPPTAVLPQGGFPLNDYRGSLELICRVAGDRLANCRSVEPSPPQEMLDAAIAAAQLARIASTDSAGRATADRDVLVEISFPLIVMDSPPAQPQPSVLIGVIWLQRPNAEQFAQYYPPAAGQQRLGGNATLECLVDATGHLSCRVISEAPEGLGFGEAALRLSQFFQAGDKTSAGVATSGGRVRVNLTFNPP